MKKQLQEFLSFNHVRYLFLAMMLFIGQGLFSQGTITVTTNADSGAGSLRQAIADADSGDVIIFDGAITTITLNSSLELGDSSITIDGGGDVVLHREVVAIDSFRLVTITGAANQVITIKDLTVENGFANGVRGGGIHADHSAGGATHLEGIIFKNNKTNAEGGGLSIKGLSLNDAPSTVTNCQFIENEVLSGGGGDGGGLIADETIITGCIFKNNVADDDGGALWLSDALVSDSHIEGSTGGDAGGAVRIQGNSTFTNCTFDGNSSEGQAGAIFMAHGTVRSCVFTNNITAGQGGAISANNNDSYIENCTFIGNNSFTIGGAVYIDDGGSLTNCIALNNTAAQMGGGIYLAGKNAPASILGSAIAHNTADSIGGGVYVAKGNIINSTIAMNYAADNGGGVSGDGAWLIANSILYGNDAVGADKNIQLVNNSFATALVNSASDTDYSAQAWASGAIALTASPFVGGTGADSLMVPYSSALIDAGSTDAAITDLLPATDLNGTNRIINGVVDLGAYERYQNFVVTTDADEGAGSLRQMIADAIDGESIITFADGITTIKVDTTLELGDKTLIIEGGGDVILDGTFNGDVALDTCGIISITGVADKMVTIQNLTIQNGYNEDGNGGGISADHSAGGKTILENVVFKDNTALRFGGGLYLKGLSGNLSTVTNCEFVGNYVDNGSGEGDGGGMWASFTMVTGCTFTDNEAMDDAGGAYIDDEAEIWNSTFTGNIAGGSGGAVRTADQTNMMSGCTFDSNISADEGGGAVFLARGSMIDCDIINNTTDGNGGGVSANQNECLLDNCLISGNTAGGIGGGAYIDDGGVLSNCVVTNNTATDNGGGLYLAGKNAPATSVGCVVANNTSNAKGGGLYVLSADVVNSILTMNSAGTNGGAFTGETGPWFMANTIVWDNDATGADKNIEVVSNSATDHAANCAIDATAYNAAGWTATNIITLNASPFVGGTGVDSLYSLPTSGLIDAGTLDHGVQALLPAMDLDGNDRIQGTIDIGVYETEIIGVLGVSLDLSSLAVSVGGTGTIVATVEPAEAGNKTVIWTSSDEGVATVADGVVTGVSAGTATITATTADGGYTATCAVTVSIAVTGVSLDQNAVTLKVNETVTLVATIEPANATNQTVGWVSGNEDVATVNNSGLVTAVAPGSATISVITVDGTFMAFCEVTVEAATVAVTGVSLDQATLALEPGGTATLVATVAPAEATDKSVSWSTSDAAVATVADGVVTAVADGTCTITVTTTDGGKTATCAVTVESVGVEDFEAGFRLYPNPVKNTLFIDGANIHSVALYSLTGNALMIVEEGVSEGINVASIESGMYILKITSEHGTAVRTIVKE